MPSLIGRLFGHSHSHATASPRDNASATAPLTEATSATAQGNAGRLPGRGFHPLARLTIGPKRLQRQRELLAQYGIEVRPGWLGFSASDEAQVSDALAVLNRSDGSSPELNEALHEACVFGRRDSWQAIATLIKHRVVDPNEFILDGKPMLHLVLSLAVDHNPLMSHATEQHVSRDERIAILLAHGAHIDQRDAAGELPLAAARRLDPQAMAEVLPRLLEAANGPLQQNQDGNTLLHDAARHGDLATLQDYSAHRYDIDGCRNRDGKTPLMVAVENKRTRAELFLLEHTRSSATATDRNGATPLLLAIDNRAPRSVVVPLLVHGADADAQTQFGWTANNLDQFRRVHHATAPILPLLLRGYSAPSPFWPFIDAHPLTIREVLAAATRRDIRTVPFI